MKNTIKLFFLGIFLFGTTISRAQITTATGGATNVLPNSPTTNTNVGIGTNTPTEKLHVVGNIKASGLATFALTVTATRLISNVATGTSPLTVTSTTVVPNLNADLLDGLHATSFQTALINPITGLLTSGYIPKATGTNTLGNGILLDNTSHIVLQTAGTPYLKITDGTGFVNMGVDTATGNSTFYNSGTYHRFLINELGYDAMRINSTGNVLIGTTTDSGIDKLQVNGSGYFNGNVRFSQPYGLLFANGQYVKDNGSAGLSLSSAGAFNIIGGGNVLINKSTDNTVDKLQVNGNISIPFGTAYKMYDAAGTGWGQMLYNNTYDRIDFNRGIQAVALTLTTAPTTSTGTYDILTRNTSTGAVESKASTFFATSANNIYTNDGTLSGARTVTMGANPITFSGTANYIINAGNVGIGSANPDEKLTVKGKIHAEEIKVDLLVPADYVFQKYYTGKSQLKSDYSMPTLTEVEAFTKANHHLPNVPSAKQIQQNGFALGEMSNVLLQKVEELTLYIIGQNKDIEELKSQVKALLVKKQ
ncbi:hypothetical protein [Flavobacterium sp.]|uniref:hypothetical protein n=1 Tax=Flavobacterium sp. TaxID=239 RepID=UPI00286BF189|nr:hypothetical protein [Flavobacterium sp.]